MVLIENKIPKNVDDRYLVLCKENLVKKYTNKIKDIFENVD